MRSKILAMLFLGLIIPAVCSAQAIKPGKWTGSVAPPEQDEVAVTYDVLVFGDSLGIVIHAGEHGDFPVTAGRYADKTISFTFVPGGPTVHCVLKENAESVYAGSCLGDDGSVATMKMVPPKDM